MEQVAEIGEAVTSCLAYIGASCNPCLSGCLFYLVGPFRSEPLRFGSCRLTSDGS
jgi:hypothetical protein